jgi:hypothetical protein
MYPGHELCKRVTTVQTAESLLSELCNKRTTSVGPINLPILKTWALQAAEKLATAGVLKGYEFIRAVKSLRMTAALAAAGWGQALECR